MLAGRGRALTPQLVDHPVQRNLRGMHDQQREDRLETMACTGPGRGNREQLAGWLVDAGLGARARRRRAVQPDGLGAAEDDRAPRPQVLKGSAGARRSTPAMARSAPSHVTQDELRAALTAGASQRSPAWNWNAELGDPERTELDGLRRHVADLLAHTAHLRKHADTATKTAQDLLTRRSAARRATPRRGNAASDRRYARQRTPPLTTAPRSAGHCSAALGAPRRFKSHVEGGRSAVSYVRPWIRWRGGVASHGLGVCFEPALVTPPIT